MKLQEAKRLAVQVLDFLAPHCQLIEIAGSIRREKPSGIKDIELVAISKRVAVDGTLIDVGDTVAKLNEYIAKHANCGAPLGWNDEHGRKNGDRFKALLWRRQPVDLFIVAPETWGALLAIRTGPADFSQLLVTSVLDRGAMPGHLKQKHGRLWHGNEPLETPTEQEWFAALDVPCWPPEQRTAARLTQHIRERGRQHVSAQSEAI